MKLLVTGAFGDLGRAVIDLARERGHTLTVFDRPSLRTRLLAHRLRRSAGAGAVRVVWGDIRDAEAVGRAVEGQDAVFHAAAILAPASERAPELAHAVNVDGTRHVLSRSPMGPTRWSTTRKSLSIRRFVFLYYRPNVAILQRSTS